MSCHGTPSGDSFGIPNGGAGIGFDDLRYSASLHRVLVPGGRSGVLALIEPESGKITTIGGFATEPGFDGGHDTSVTSVGEGRGLLFATDRTAGKVNAADPTTARIVASADLGSGPDYVRFVEPTGELWISEPSASQVEIFSVSKESPPVLTRAGSITFDNGPESLVIDAARDRAYTHHWQKSTAAIDLRTRQVVAEWTNGCASSRGIEVDPQTGFVFAACSEGTVTVMDPSQGGRILSTLARGAGYDVMGYSASLRHVYLAGSACACLTTLAVSTSGELSFLGRADAPSDTHCVVADDVGNAWVCDPSGGRVWRVHDGYPRSM
jgi:DNA-binding beta-propeller fold protein YncE